MGKRHLPQFGGNPDILAPRREGRSETVNRQIHPPPPDRETAPNSGAVFALSDSGVIIHKICVVCRDRSASLRGAQREREDDA
jgi:hypothetical protein